jgi:hypothetical protein
MPIVASISAIGKVIAIMGCRSRAQCLCRQQQGGRRPSFMGQSATTDCRASAEPTKITREAEGRKKRESQTSQALSKPENAQQTAFQGAQNPSEE